MFFIHIMPLFFIKVYIYFIHCLEHFHCDFHLYSLIILLDISLIIPGIFIANFILIPWRYHWIFHCLSLGLSLQFSFILLGNIIEYFIGYLWHFHYDFH